MEKDIDEESTDDRILVVVIGLRMIGLRMMDLLLILTCSCKQEIVYELLYELSGEEVINKYRE